MERQKIIIIWTRLKKDISFTLQAKQVLHIHKKKKEYIMKRMTCFLFIFQLPFLLFSHTYSQTRTIDLNSIEPDLTIIGHDHNKLFGESIAAGDINGDGYQDILISATQSHIDTANLGSVYILLGTWERKTEIDLKAMNPDIEIRGRYVGGLFGSALEVYDFNVDGYDDIVISETRADPLNRDDAGIIYLFYGKNDFNDIIDLSQDGADVTFTGAQAGDHFGTAISSGDVNGNGKQDLVIGAEGVDSAENITCGGTYIILNTIEWSAPATIDLSGDFTGHLIYGKEANDLSGRAVGCTDIDYDGRDDVIIGAHKADSPIPNLLVDAGEIYIMFGANDFPYQIDLSLRKPDITIIGNEKRGWFGFSILAQDINRDGFGEVIVGAPQENYFDKIDAGSVYILNGRSLFAGPESLHIDDVEDKIKIVGHMESANIGWSIATADFDANDLHDIAIGCPQAASLDRQYSGSTFIVYDTFWENYLVDLNDFNSCCTVLGEDKQGFLGKQIAICDLNNDLLPDLIMSAPDYENRGIVYSLFNNVLTSISNNPEIYMNPETFSLLQNYPNPFSSYGNSGCATQIRFNLNKAAVISLDIINIRGQYVATIIKNRKLNSGSYSFPWNGVTRDQKSASPGVYIYRLRAGNKYLHGKMMLIH